MQEMWFSNLFLGEYRILFWDLDRILLAKSPRYREDQDVVIFTHVELATFAQRFHGHIGQVFSTSSQVFWSIEGTATMPLSEKGTRVRLPLRSTLTLKEIEEAVDEAVSTLGEFSRTKTRPLSKAEKKRVARELYDLARSEYKIQDLWREISDWDTMSSAAWVVWLGRAREFARRVDTLQAIDNALAIERLALGDLTAIHRTAP
jgi:hypothetical protein